jgi:hypothetical protein
VVVVHGASLTIDHRKTKGGGRDLVVVRFFVEPTKSGGAPFVVVMIVGFAEPE